MTILVDDGFLCCELHRVFIYTVFIKLRDFVVMIEFPYHVAHVFAVLAAHP
jgi:hypothetical protein